MTIIKQLFRASARLVIFLLLLSLSGAVLCMGVNAYENVNRQAEAIQERYTTIAVPNYALPELLDDFESYSWIEEKQKERVEFVKEAIEAAKQSEYIRYADERNLISAYVEGRETLMLKDLKWPSINSEEFDGENLMGVIVATCKGFEENRVMDVLNSIYVDGEMQTYYDKTYEIKFEIDECVSVNSAYSSLEEVTLVAWMLTEEGEIPFKEGKKYILWGSFDSPMMTQSSIGKDEWTAEGDFRFVLNDGGIRNLQYYFMYNGSGTSKLVEIDGKQYEIISNREDYPLYAELQDGETVEEFLASDRGKAWKENVIPLCEINRQSVPVMTTEWIESLLLFNTNEAGIMEGRTFTQQEYEEQAKVCIVSAAYADKNGLQVGDSLPMQLYDRGYIKTDAILFTADALQKIENKMVSMAYPDTYYQMNGYRMDIPLAEVDNYTIIGIYQSPGFVMGAHNFSPNTIFIPGNTVNISRYPENIKDSDLNIVTMGKANNMEVLTSFVLENGKLQAFQLEMSALGYGNCFLYFDQDYEATGGAGTDVMRVNAQRLLLFGVLLFVTASILTIFLYCRWCQHSAMILRLTGMSKKHVLWEIMVGLFGMASMSIILSSISGVALFQIIYRVVFANGDNGRISFMAMTSVIMIEMVFLSLVGVCFAIKTISMNLMKNKKGE